MPTTADTPRLKPDRLFAGANFPKPFEFNAAVAEVFDDMVSRSVPLYRENLEYAVAWAKRLYQPGSYVVDLGCSTGTLFEALAHVLPENTRFYGVDASSAMIERARAKLAELSANRHIEFCMGDLQTTHLPENISLAFLNYTLQFLPVRSRAPLLSKIYHRLAPGGVLWLAEKLRGEGPLIHEGFTEIYEDFKLNQGYSKTEIERKKEALDNVLVPLTSQEQQDLLYESGFRQVDTALRWHNFASFIAVK